MGSENGLWQTLRTNMGWQQATRHEDKLNAGVCDVSFAHDGHGWLELKHSHTWPKRAGTVVRLEHFTEEQRAFLHLKGFAGGRTWLLWQVERDYLLFRWNNLTAIGTTTRDQLYAACDRRWERRLDYAELLEWLCDRRTRGTQIR